MSTKSRQPIYGGRIIGAKVRAEGARKRAAEAIGETDRAEAEAWSIQMERYGGRAQPSPTIGQRLNGGYGWLEVECHRCKAGASIPLDAAWRLSDWSASVSGFKNNNDARRFGFVWPQARQGLIAPAGKADNFTSLNFFFRHFGRLQDIEAAAIEKECMIPKQVVQLPDGGMVVGKYLGMELAQGLVYLCRV
jgi:hypothetical protein